MFRDKVKIPRINTAIMLCLWASTSVLMAQTDKAPEKQEPIDHNLQYINAQHVLDGTRFEYFYQGGGGLQIAFADGQLQYEWISGPRKGNNAKEIPYQSREIGEDVYLVNWHEKDKPDFVTLIIDLKQNRLYSSAILRYGTSKEMIHFKESTIKHVKRPAK